MSKATLLQGDCMELMSRIPDGSIDMVLSDLPYGTTRCRWDTPINLQELWKQYRRVVKENGAIVLFSAQPFTAELISSNKVFFAFNNSGTTVALKTVRKTMNYDLDIEVVEVAGGQVGDVIVYDKQLNGFKLKFEGSAKTVKVKYKVRGGMYA